MKNLKIYLILFLKFFFLMIIDYFLILIFTALKIHISPQCKEYLDKLGGYVTSDRGLVKMKVSGKF